MLIDMKSRASLDPLYESGTYTHVFDVCTRVVNMRFRARRWCQSNRRDFALLMHWRVRDDGSVIIMGRSTEHASCPPHKV
jgi:hypothetical protein